MGSLLGSLPSGNRALAHYFRTAAGSNLSLDSRTNLLVLNYKQSPPTPRVVIRRVPNESDQASLATPHSDDYLHIYWHTCSLRFVFFVAVGRVAKVC